MSLVYQIPRKALWWLLIAQAAVILPLLQHLPSWLILVWTVCVAWRVQIVRGVYDAPKSICKNSFGAGHGGRTDLKLW